MESDEGIYHAAPQTQGKMAHETVDNRKASNQKGDLVSYSVYSERFGLMGKIDIYKREEKLLIERKYNLKQIYQGQIYQLWAQYFCLTEMGVDVNQLAFYEISTNRKIHIDIPNDNDCREFIHFIERIRNFNPEAKFLVNSNKCIHCIYCNLCDKTNCDNVYE